MGVAVIFGLGFATFLTLIVVPVAYAALDDLSLRLRNLLGMKVQEIAESELKALPESKSL